MRIESASNVTPSIPWQSSRARQSNGQEFTPDQLEKIEELEKRDEEVRRHEEAHRAAAGQYAIGGPKYEFETGPDHVRYAVGGEVNIDTSPIPDDPEGTIRKAEQIKRAAMAPAEPSPKDRRVASEADQMKAKAQKEIAEQARTGGEKEKAAAGSQPEASKESAEAGEQLDYYA